MGSQRMGDAMGVMVRGPAILAHHPCTHPPTHPPAHCSLPRLCRSDNGGASFLGEALEAVKAMVESNQ